MSISRILFLSIALLIPVFGQANFSMDSFTYQAKNSQSGWQDWLKDEQNQHKVGNALGAVVGFAYMALVVYIQWHMLKAIRGEEFKVYKPGEIKERFSSVAGNNQAKKACSDIVEYLKNPEKYAKIGANVTKGVLLTGDPGTGKTLLARALAGEANCSFIYASGSEFNGMFQGSGTQRVKRLFIQARSQKSLMYVGNQQPCIIFIDEADAIAGKRGSGNQERDNTVNQLLTELDGFTTNQVPIIVIMATNHPENLDEAVVRPGRIDRTIHVELPDAKDREGILRIHLQKVVHTPETAEYLKFIADRLIGFSGAKLAGIIHTAARLAVDGNKDAVTPDDLEEAVEMILLGAPSEHAFSLEDSVQTAYHEAGHALVSMLLQQDCKKVKRLSIIPRGHTGGVTYIAPLTEIKYWTKEQFLNDIAVAMGGRAAEEIQFGKVTTGPISDLDRAKNIAKHMIKRFGMGSAIFLNTKDEEKEISEILETQYKRAKNLLVEYKSALDAIAQAALEKQTLKESDLDLLNPRSGLNQKILDVVTA